MKKTIKGRFASKIDIGKVRLTNEDQAFALINSSGDVLLGVCDGMGGHNKGDYASRLAKDIICEAFRTKDKFFSNASAKHWLAKVVKQVNLKIYNDSFNNEIYRGMGTTLVMALIYRDQIHVLNIGDSRAYIVRYTDLKRLTEDQTYVEYLYHMGKISKEEIETSSDRHILMNALGTFPSVSFKITSFPNLKNPIFLCSDGVYNNSSEKEIHQALSTNERIEQKIDSLIAIANSNGGSDNMAIAYWEAIEND
ncbi:MAG: protein phosphatase 2C domain-containing protein [Bacilli bacterium]|nr:protein phosphatase 2C domain-containing protein [Bacilli bacterium]